MFKGRLSFKQYIPSKRHRFGIKLFVLCTCETGMVIDMIVYTGKNTDNLNATDELGVSGCIVKLLLAPCSDAGRLLYTDNWYTSPLLAHYLHRCNTGLCGTLRRNCKRMPNFLKLKKKEVRRQKSEGILVLKWRDKRDVHVLTTFHKGRMLDSGKKDPKTDEPVMKPDIIIDCNENVRLVDKSAMQIGGVQCVRRTIKWYKKLFFHMVDILVLSAYSMFLTKTGNRLPLRQFFYNMAFEILERYGTPVSILRGCAVAGSARQPDRLAGREWVSRHYLVLVSDTAGGKTGTRNCVVCAHTKGRARK